MVCRYGIPRVLWLQISGEERDRLVPGVFCIFRPYACWLVSFSNLMAGVGVFRDLDFLSEFFHLPFELGDVIRDDGVAATQSPQLTGLTPYTERPRSD
jgi:hypothetical protein